MMFRCMLAWLLLAAICPAQPSDMAERLAFADGLYARHMYELAAKEYAAFLRDAPDTATGHDVAHYRLGECLFRAGKPTEAERQFRIVFTEFPESPFRFRAGFRRAEVFLDAGQYAAAIDLFGAVRDAGCPKDMAMACAYYRAVAQLNLSQVKPAASALEEVAASGDAGEYAAHAWLKLGEIHARRGSELGETEDKGQTRALACYEQVASLPAPDALHAEALFQRAQLHFLRKEHEKSAVLFRALVSTYPDDARVAAGRIQAAWAAHNAGLFAEALGYAADGLAAAAPADRPEWLYLKANCERQLMKHAPALASYGALLRDYPDSRFAEASRYEMGLTYFKQGKFHEAVGALSSLAPSGALREDVYWLSAQAYAALKDDDKAVQFYRLLIRDFPDSSLAADALYRLAHHLQDRGEHQEAARQYGLLAARFPDRDLAPQSLFAAAWNLEKAGLLEEAVRDFALLLEKYPASAFDEDALYRKAMSELRIDRAESAVAGLRKLLKTYPKTRFAPDAHYWLGYAARARDDLAEAEKELRAVRARGPAAKLGREADFLLGVVLRDLGQFDEAASLLDALVAQGASELSSPSLLEWLSTFAYDEKRYDAAAAAAERMAAVSQTPASRQMALVLLGRARLAQDDKVAAAQAFRDAMAVKANTVYGPEAALRLGELAEADGDHETAMRRFRECADRASTEDLIGLRVRAYAGLARAYRTAGNDEEAARYFMSVAVLFDDPEIVPECLAGAAAAYGRLGRPADRRRVLKELAARYPDSRQAVEAGALPEAVPDGKAPQI